MIAHPFKKEEEPSLDPQVVGQMLETIFDQCEKEPNTVPLEILTSYRNYRRERYALQKLLLAAILAMFFFLPLLFLAPSFSLTPGVDEQRGKPVYRVEVDTFLPISRVTAVIDGQNTAVYQTGNCAYLVEPARNGELTVTVTLANRQYTEKKILVDHVDLDPPELLSSSRSGDQICLYVQDEISGVDYEHIYARTLEGEIFSPTRWDADLGCVWFDYPKQTLNVYVPDRFGNRLQLVLSVDEDP